MMTLTEPCFEAKNLTIGLYGYEWTKFRKLHAKGGYNHTVNPRAVLIGYSASDLKDKSFKSKHYYWDTHHGKNKIIEQEFILQEYSDGPPTISNVSFPFSIELPFSLAPSIYLASDDIEKTRLGITYELRAQVNPVHEQDWMDIKHTISSFHGSQMIIVTKTEPQEAVQD